MWEGDGVCGGGCFKGRLLKEVEKIGCLIGWGDMYFGYREGHVVMV